MIHLYRSECLNRPGDQIQSDFAHDSFLHKSQRGKPRIQDSWKEMRKVGCPPYPGGNLSTGSFSTLSELSNPLLGSMEAGLLSAQSGYDGSMTVWKTVMATVIARKTHRFGALRSKITTDSLVFIKMPPANKQISAIEHVLSKLCLLYHQPVFLLKK